MGPISIFFGSVILAIIFGVIFLVIGGLWTLAFALLRRWRRARSVVVIAGIALAVALMGLFLLGIASLFGLDELIPVSERSMVGTWVVHYRTDDGRPAGNDTLILKPDHTFVQICLPEKGKKIEAVIGGRPVEKYDRVRMTGTWRKYGSNKIDIEGALGPPGYSIVFGNPCIRYAPSSVGTWIQWRIRGPAIYARGDPDSATAEYFEKVK